MRTAPTLLLGLCRLLAQLRVVLIVLFATVQAIQRDGLLLTSMAPRQKRRRVDSAGASPATALISPVGPRLYHVSPAME